MSIPLFVSAAAPVLDHLDALTLADRAPYVVAMGAMIVLAAGLVALKLRSK